MNERGVGYLIDMLMFALLISFANLFLLNTGLPDSEIESVRYATSFAQSVLLGFQHATIDGFEYRFDVSDYESFPFKSSDRNLSHKTIAQLLAEYAFLNSRIEIGGIELVAFGLDQNLKSEVRKFLKEVIDEFVDGRFGYHLMIKTSFAELNSSRIRFEDEVKDLEEARRKLCSETIITVLPFSWEELAKRIEGFSRTELKPEPVIVEITLELWSR